MKQKKNLFTIIALIILAIALIAVAIITLSKGGNKDIQEKLDLGQNYLDELKYEQALASYMAVLEIDPNNGEAYVGIVKAYMGMDDTENAVKYAQEGYALTGNAELREILTQLGITPTGGPYQELLDKGWAHLEAGEYEDALVCFEEILKQAPTNAEAYLGIVEIYIRTSEFDKALEQAKKGYDLTGDERLKEKIDMLESGNIVASDGLRMGLVKYDNNGKLQYQYDYSYNENRKLQSVIAYNASGVQFDVFQGSDLGENWVQDVTFMNDDGSIRRRDRLYENGLLIKEMGYQDDDTTVNSTTTYEYNDAGLLVRSNQEDIYGVGNLRYTLYEYNEANQKTKETWYANDAVNRYILYYYNADGTMDRFEEHHESGEMYRKVVYSYENGERVGYTEYDGSGKQTGEVRYK